MAGNNPFEDPNYGLEQGSESNPFNNPDYGKETDGPLARGWKKSKQSIAITRDLTLGDADSAAQNIAEADRYARENPSLPEGRELSQAWDRGEGISGGIKEVAGEIKKDWDEADGVIGGLRATGRNVRAMAEGVIEQTPNMVAPVTGMLAGGFAGAKTGAALGSVVPGVGTAIGAKVGGIAGGWAGASAGNAAIEGGYMLQDRLAKAGINPQDQEAVRAFVEQNGDSVLGDAGIKGGIIGAVDVATLGIAGKLLNGPARAAASRALADMGVDATNKAAVKAAMEAPEFAQRIANDAVYQASRTGAQNVARNVGAAALEPAGEFTGEYLGQGVATGEWDTKNAALEAFSSIGQSGMMFAGQKAYQYATRPRSANQPAEEAPPPAAEAPQDEPRGFGPTAERPIIDDAALARVGVFPPAPAPIINERALETVTPSQQMGLDPAAGPMSAAAALAVDTGASATMQQAAQAVDPETGEILQAGAKATEQNQATDTPEQMRERLAFIEQQARVNGGWDRRAIEERDRIQAELAKVEPAPPVASPAAASQPGAVTDMVEPAPAIDVSGRTDEQLRVLEKSGRDGWREAATAEIQRRAVQQPVAAPAPAAETMQPAVAEQPTQTVAKQAEPVAPTAAADDLRRQLQEVESKILAAAPDAMGAGGGDIEAAMKSRKVPVTLKAQRKRIKEQLKQTNATFAQGAQTANVSERVEVAPQAQEAGGQEGEKTFAPETGTLGIPRAEMPQVPTKSHGGLVKHLNAQGIAHETTSVDAASLKPTQAEFSPEKVEAAKTAAGDRAVIVSSDGHIVDGHHQALAAAEEGKQVKAIVIDAPIDQALEAVKNSPSAQTHGARGQEGAQESRDSLIERYRKVELFSDEEYALSDRLVEMTRAEVSAKVERGEMPVFDTGRDTFATISPSAQQPGKFQVTRYNKGGVFGDTQYDTIEAAISDNRFKSARILTDEEAGTRFAESMEAESEYQRRRAEGQSAIEQATWRAATDAAAQPQQPQAKQADTPEFTTLKDRDGKTVTVRTADLEGDRKLLQTFTKDGKRKATRIHRDNLDPTGEKREQGAKQIAANPLFNVITAKDGKPFAVKAAASRELNARGLAETHEIVSAKDAGVGDKGYVIQRRNAAEQAATHKDPGQPAEPVTAPVIAEAIQKSARNTDFNPAEAKAWLIAEIDRAIANVPDEHAELQAQMERERKNYFDRKAAENKFGKGSKKIDAARDAFDNAKDARMAKLAERIGFVTFDVPGDGKFKVVNTIEKLNEFKDKVKSSPGFAKNPDRPMGYGTGMAGAVSLDQAIADAKKEGRDGDVLAEIGNAIEIARLRNKGDGALLTRFQKESGGKSYDDWRAEREAEEEAAAQAESRPAEFVHEGVRIYPATVNVAGERKQMWAVESDENKAKREAGERHGFGDNLFDTKEQAKAHADRQIERAQRDAERERRNAEVEAQQQAEAAARKADTINGFIDGKAPNTQELIRKALDKQVRFNGEVMTVRQYVELKASAGTLDPGSFDEPKVKPMSRTQFNRASQREQDAHEKRMREAGTKTVYTVNGYELGKHAHDYAQHLLAVNAEPELQRHYAAQRAYADHRKQFLANFTGQELRKQERFVEAAASKFTAGRIMGLRGGQTVEVADGALGEGGTATVYMLAPSGEFVSVESIPLERTALYRASEAGAEPAQQPEPQAAGAAAPATDNARDTFTVERVDENQRETLTFRRGETVKVSGAYPMMSGKIEGISQANRQFKVGGVWYDFGYAYKSDYDEFAAPRREMDEYIATARKRIADGSGFSRSDGYPIRDAREHAKRYALKGYDDTLNELEAEGQRVHDAFVARERERIEKADKEAQRRREEEMAREQDNTPIKMTMDEWKRIHKDFKSFNGGNRTVLHGGRIRAVEIVKEEKASNAAPAPDSLTAQHEALMEAVRTGTATPESFKAIFEKVVSGADAIKAELGAKTKAELLRIGGPYIQMRHANDKKDDVVDAVYRSMIGEYALGESVTYGIARDSYQNAVRKMVDATDADKLAKYVEDRKAAIEEALERRKARAEALANPKTLDDFRSLMNIQIREGKTRKEAFLMLTPEQRIQYDTLEAEATRERRESRKRAAVASVRATEKTTGGEIVATKHTKTGEDLFMVQPAERVERDTYDQWNAAAKRLGGRYSSYRGNGAVPGFMFRSRESAEAFVKFIGGDASDAQQIAKQRRDAFEDDRSQTAAQRLNEMADRIEDAANEELGRDRKANTARRARFASAALNAAESQKALAKTMRNIANAIEGGKAKFLDAVRTKTQVEMLSGLVRTAKDNELRAKYPTYAEQEKRKGERPTAETADFAEFPNFTAFRSDLAMLGRQMLEVEGTKKLGQKLMSVADDVTDAYLDFAKSNLLRVSQFGRGDSLADFSNRADAEKAIRRSGLTGKAIVLQVKRGQNRVILSPSEAINRNIWEGDGDKRITLSGEFGAEMVEAIGRRGNKQNGLVVPWQLQSAYDRRKALARIGVETPSEFRSALREFIDLQETAVANKVRTMELAMVGRRADGLDFFPTPAEIADQMVEAADLSPDMAVLEPSAGMGHIADRIRAAGAEPDVVEISPDRRELLEEKGYHLAEVNDFLNMEPRKFFTYGDVFRAPDGKEGILRGLGGMGSQRVRLEDEQGNRIGLYQRDEVVGVSHRGSWSGYDRIIMNPPFSDRRDAEHVQHAYTLLRPGGRIVAIMGEGVFFGQDKKAQAFRDWLDERGGTSEKLPEGSFMDPSLPVQTGVNARLVVIDKPAAGEASEDSDGIQRSATGRGALLTGITEKGLVRAMRLQFGGLSEVTQKMLERGRAGKRGGAVVINTADMREVGRIVAEKTGRNLDATMRKFSTAGVVNGFYDPKSGLTFLVGPNLNPVTATAVLLHEVMHGQQRQKIDQRAMEMVRGRESVKDPAMRSFLDRVARRMAMAGESNKASEASAYIVEQAVIEGRSAGYQFADNAFMQWADKTLGKRVGDFLRSFLGMVRTWALRNGLGTKTMSVDDFVGYAMAGMERAAAGEVRAGSATAASAGDSFSRSVGDAPVQEAQRVQSAIEGKTLIEAAQFLTRSRDGAKAAVSQKVLEKLQRLEKAGVALDLKIVHRGDMAPASMANSRGYTETGFDEKGRDIVVWLNGADMTGRVGTEEEVLLHELVHAATAGMVFYGTQAPDSLAGKHARDLMAVTDAIAEHIRERFAAADAGKATLTAFEQDMRGGANNAFRSDDEVLAWALSNSEAQAYLETIPYRSGSMWSNFVEAVRNLLGLSARNDTALSEVLRVAERILTDDAPNAGRAAFWHKRNIRMAQQQVRGSIVQTAERGADEFQFSRSGMDGAQALAKNIGDGLKSITVQDVKKAGKHKLTDWLKLGLQFMGRRQLVDVYGDVLPLAEYDRLAAQMEADKNDVGASADDLARRWGKLPDEGKLAELMHDATLAQIDADDAVEYMPGDDLSKSRMLKAQFAQLSPEAQKVYREARDHYRKHHAEVRQAITDRIMRSELREERRAELLKRMDDDFFKSIKGVYFPLARFGQYVVVTKDETGKVASVSRAETMAEAEAMRQEMVKAFPAKDGYQVGRVILSKEFIAGRDMVGRGFMSELFNALDEQQLDPRVMAELEDTLGQLYLSSLPDLSWAKHGIHRKGTPGFSQDARRAFAQNTFHGARYLAKLRYGDQMQAELDRMQKHVDEMSAIEDFDQPAAQRVVDEMNKRHEAMMNPKSNPLSTALTSFGFVYYLGISPAAAVVNLSQTPLVAYPVLGAKWGFRKAGAALMTASKETMEGKNDLRSRLKNADEIAAYDEAVRTGVIDVTMAHDLAGIAQGEDAKVMWKIRPVMRAASFLFHHAERFNRQATFMAAYRLAREAGAKHDAAYAQAVKATYDGHFDYSAGNRPRVMQGNVAKVVLLFKQYAQNMIYTIARNAYQSVKGESPEVRREARKVFASLMTMHAAAAGVLGLPMVGTLLALASALGGSDDEPWDAEVALRNMLADAFGPKASEVIARGFSRLTPWDVSGRVGLDKLLLPDVNESLEGQRWAEAFATAMLGPVIGMGVNAAKGAQKMSDGDYARGLEDILPIFARNPIKAYRQYSEGEVDRTGVVVKDEVSLAGVLGQASGFSPSEIRLAFEGRSAVMSADRRLNERRQDLMTQFARAAMEQDQDGMAEARSAIAEFNKVNPGRRITPPQLWQSVRNRQRRIREADDGVYLPRTRRDALEAGRFAEVG